MKSYSHIISKLFYEPLLVTPMRHAALLQMLELRLSGQRLDVPGNSPAPAGPQVDDDEMLEGSTAIIPVHGTLVMHPEDIAMSECGCAMEDLSAAIDKVENDSRIQRVIYDFRTPGGTVTGIPEAGRVTAEMNAVNAEVSRQALSFNCLTDLRGADGKLLPSTATEHERQTAAELIPVADKLKAIGGAVNAAVQRTGVTLAAIPGTGTTQINGAKPAEQEVTGRARFNQAVKKDFAGAKV